MYRAVPSFAMQARWTRPFSSAYGSTGDRSELAAHRRRTVAVLEALAEGAERSGRLSGQVVGAPCDAVVQPHPLPAPQPEFALAHRLDDRPSHECVDDVPHGAREP